MHDALGPIDALITTQGAFQMAEAFPDADKVIIDRQVNRHAAFGLGIHRCVGNRLGEMQLRIVWEEILKRFPKIEVVGEPKRVFSSFVHGYEQLPVVIPN